MTAIPTGISEAHEVDVRLTCDAGLYVIPEQIVDRITGALREAKAALLDGDTETVRLAIEAAARAVGEIEVDGGVCTFEGAVEGYYFDEETAEATCPTCGTVHDVDL